MICRARDASCSARQDSTGVACLSSAILRLGTDQTAVGDQQPAQWLEAAQPLRYDECGDCSPSIIPKRPPGSPLQDLISAEEVRPVILCFVKLSAAGALEVQAGVHIEHQCPEQIAASKSSNYPFKRNGSCGRPCFGFFERTIEWHRPGAAALASDPRTIGAATAGAARETRLQLQTCCESSSIREMFLAGHCRLGATRTARRGPGRSTSRASGLADEKARGSQRQYRYRSLRL